MSVCRSVIGLVQQATLSQRASMKLLVSVPSKNLLKSPQLIKWYFLFPIAAAHLLGRRSESFEKACKRLFHTLPDQEQRLTIPKKEYALLSTMHV
jgi:hypothetical protein